MRFSVLALAILAGAVIAPGVSAAVPIAPGTYTNEEEVYFDKEAKRPSAPWTGVAVDTQEKVTFIDLFGRRVAPVAYKLLAPVKTAGRVSMTLPDGRVTELRLARTATCWGAAPKAVKKADGSEDWFGARDLKLHDQGGRAMFGGGDAGAPAVVLRMRNVIWPSGSSRPSLVLYIHTPDAPDKAVSYSWADPGAKTIGINLRWMQASCTIDS